MKSYRHTIMLLIREIECRMNEIDPKEIYGRPGHDISPDAPLKLQLYHTANQALWEVHNMEDAAKMEAMRRDYGSEASVEEATDDVCLDKRNVIQFKRRAV